MGLIGSTQSVSRYHVKGRIESEKVRNGLIKYSIPKTENDYDIISAGWTPLESPYNPDFEQFSFVFGTYFVFSLRIDKKSIPAKLIQKHMAVEIEKKKKITGQEFVFKNELATIKEMVMDNLMRKIPSIPNVYDVLWDYEENNLYLFTTQKAANEFFVTMFLKSFELRPVRLFPYTIIETKSKFSDKQKDKIFSLTPLKYLRKTYTYA